MQIVHLVVWCFQFLPAGREATGTLDIADGAGQGLDMCPEPGRNVFVPQPTRGILAYRPEMWRYAPRRALDPQVRVGDEEGGVVWVGWGGGAGGVAPDTDICSIVRRAADEAGVN